jgi:hypothetical protein
MLQSSINSFWAKVEKSDCWLWLAAKTDKGYGVFSVDGRTKKAHRLAYELTRGEIPHGLCVLHRCDTPACCNPNHLFLGTRAENNSDMMAKGRHVSGGTHKQPSHCAYQRGESHHAAKMTEDMVRIMRADRLSGASFSVLGEKYGVAGSAAYKICKGLLWKHI